MSCIATGAHVPSDHSPIQSGLGSLFVSWGWRIILKAQQKNEEERKIRKYNSNASSHLCQGIYYSNDVECVKVSPSREVWKEYDLKKHEKKKNEIEQS